MTNLSANDANKLWRQSQGRKEDIHNLTFCKFVHFITHSYPSFLLFGPFVGQMFWMCLNPWFDACEDCDSRCILFCFFLPAKANDVPPDALALLDMNGIDVTRWKRLQHLHYDDAWDWVVFKLQKPCSWTRISSNEGPWAKLGLACHRVMGVWNRFVGLLAEI